MKPIFDIDSLLFPTLVPIGVEVMMYSDLSELNNKYKFKAKSIINLHNKSFFLIRNYIVYWYFFDIS